uniref:Zinc finger protein 567 n=1 Tax=Culex pipiens TaxID=7175 RepID=A0A8D8AA06_CULPI
MTSRTRKLARLAAGHQRPAESPSSLMCRVCARSKPESQLIGLFDERVQGESLAFVLSQVGAVEIYEQDHIPNLCCHRCHREVESAYRLRLLCQDSDRKLRELFAEREDKVEIKVEAEECAVQVSVDPMGVEYITCKADVFAVEGMEVDDSGEKALLDPVQAKVEIEDSSGAKEDEPSSSEDGSDSDHNDDDRNDLDEEDEDSEPPRRKKKTAIVKKPTKTEFPDVFEEIPAVSFICCGCRNRFPTQEDLQTHSQAVHAVNKLPASKLKGRKQCEICYKNLRDSYAYELHKQIGKVNYRCKTCGDVFPSRKRVCTHHERIHGPHPVVTGSVRICCGCAQKFDTLEDLKKHSDEAHLPKKLPPDEKRPFICEICYHNFPTELRLYAHQIRLIKGRNEKKHQCVHCGKTFISAGVLRDHEISHTGEKVFQCTDCPKTYTNKDAYRKHIYRHAQPRDRYRCEVCDRTFKTKQSLYEHGLAHTGERPLKCPYCPARFAREACRISHVRTHTGKKDFPCPQCDKRFPCSSDRNRHLNYFHNKERPFPCFFCPNRYPRKDYRKKHMENVHAAELAANPVPAIELSGGNRWTSTAPVAVPAAVPAVETSTEEK